MELVLRTGWTPDVLGAVPGALRRALHWRLWAEAVVGRDGLPDTRVPSGASDEVRTAYAQNAVRVDHIRRFLFPEGD